MKNAAIVVALMYLVLWAVGIAAWFTSIVVDAMHSRLVWILVDVFVSPVGVVRGVLIWLGLAG